MLRMCSMLSWISDTEYDPSGSVKSVLLYLGANMLNIYCFYIFASMIDTKIG